MARTTRRQGTSVCGTYNKNRLHKRMWHMQQTVTVTQANVAHATNSYSYASVGGTCNKQTRLHWNKQRMQHIQQEDKTTQVRVARTTNRQGYASECGPCNKQLRLHKRMRHVQPAGKVGQNDGWHGEGRHSPPSYLSADTFLTTHA